MTPAAIWQAHCRHMAFQSRAWGMDAAARLWSLAADGWAAFDDAALRLPQQDQRPTREGDDK